MHVSVSSFRPMQPGPFVHDLVLLFEPFPQVLEHLLHALHGCHSDNGKTNWKEPFVKIALFCSCSSGFVCETLICNFIFPTQLLFRNGTGLFRSVRFALAVSVWAVSVLAISVWAISVLTVSVWAPLVSSFSVWSFRSRNVSITTLR